MAEDENPDDGQYHELPQVQDVREKGAKSTVVFHCGDRANGSDSCGPVSLETTMDLQTQPAVQKVLVITDHFSRHVQAYKVPDKRAITITKCLYDQYFRHNGFPRCLMSDQGKEFCNNILKEMCYYLNIKKVRTTPYHPQSNGTVERVHQTLRCMIAKLDNK